MAWNIRRGASARAGAGGGLLHVAGEVGAVVAGPVDQRVHRVAVGGDRRQPDRAMLVADVVGLLEHDRALGGRVRDAAVDVRHRQRDVDDAVAVRPVMVGQRAGRVVGALDDEPRRAGPQHVGVVVPVPGLGTGVGDQLHPERGLQEVDGLDGVADDPDQGVPARHRERVGRRVVLDQADQLLELIEAQPGQTFVVVQQRVGIHRRSSACSACPAASRSKWIGRCATSPLSDERNAHLGH